MAKTVKIDPTSGLDIASILAKKLGVSKNTVTDSGDVLEEYLPDVGEIANAVLKGGPINIASGIIDVIKRHSDKREAELDELAELLAKPLGASIEDFNIHAEEAKRGTAELESKLAHAGTDTDPIATRFQRIKAFADVYLGTLMTQVQHKGAQEVVELQRQNASPDKIIAARQETRAKIKWLADQKAFFDGSGLLQLELEVRQDARVQLKTVALSAKDAKDKAIAKNDNLLKNIHDLLDQTGNGFYGDKDRTFITDKKRIADAAEKLHQKKADKEYAISQADRPAFSDETWQEFLHPYDLAIFDAEQDLIAATKQFENRLTLLAQLQKKQDPSGQERADAETTADQTLETAANNEKAIAQLPEKIQFAQSLEQMQQASDANVEALDAQTDKLLESPPANAPDQGSLNVPPGLAPSDTPDYTPIISGLPLPFPGPTTAAGGRRLDPDQLNEILTRLMQDQAATKKTLAEFQQTQARQEEEIHSLQAATNLLSRQLHELQHTGFR